MTFQDQFIMKLSISNSSSFVFVHLFIHAHLFDMYKISGSFRFGEEKCQEGIDSVLMGSTAW